MIVSIHEIPKIQKDWVNGLSVNQLKEKYGMTNLQVYLVTECSEGLEPWAVCQSILRITPNMKSKDIRNLMEEYRK